MKKKVTLSALCIFLVLGTIAVTNTSEAIVISPDCNGGCQYCKPFLLGEECAWALDGQSGACGCMGSHSTPWMPTCYLFGYGCTGISVS